jgi:hypothetical protein
MKINLFIIKDLKVVENHFINLNLKYHSMNINEINSDKFSEQIILE